MTPERSRGKPDVAVSRHGPMADVPVRGSCRLRTPEAARLIDDLAQALRRVCPVPGHRETAMGLP